MSPVWPRWPLLGEPVGPKVGLGELGRAAGGGGCSVAAEGGSKLAPGWEGWWQQQRVSEGQLSAPCSKQGTCPYCCPCFPIVSIAAVLVKSAAQEGASGLHARLGFLGVSVKEDNVCGCTASGVQLRSYLAP